jgi:hypothetical protein
MDAGHLMVFKTGTASRPPMTRAHLSAAAQRRPTVALLLGLALAFCLAVLSIQSSFYAAPGMALRPAFRSPSQHTKPTGSPCSHAGAPGRRLDLDADDVRDLAGFQAGGWIWTPTTCATSRGSSPASSSAWYVSSIGFVPAILC